MTTDLNKGLTNGKQKEMVNGNLIFFLYFHEKVNYSIKIYN